MPSRLRWQSRAREVPIGSRICAARVLTLVAGIEEQIRELAPRFSWPAGHDLFVAIVAAGDADVVVGFALAKDGRETKIITGDSVARRKLREAARENRGRPVGAWGVRRPGPTS